jgi:ketosteroid isomerase-like protein
MSRALVSRFCLVLCLALSEVLAQSQTPPRSGSGRIVTVTRLVAMFSDLESQWLTAIQQKDENALKRLLADDFQVWTPTPPGDPISREDWLKQAGAGKLESFHLRQMAVRSLNDETALASFVLSETVERAGKATRHDNFVVDVWRKTGDQWHVTDRYISQITGASPPARTDLKPSGKN